MTNKKNVCLYIEPDLINQAKEIKKKFGVPVSVILTNGLKQILKKYQCSKPI